MSQGIADKNESPYWPSIGGPILLFLLALFFFARPLLLLCDGGSCRHYLTGLYIMEHNAVPTTTYMSAVEPNSPWVTHELLCDLLFGIPFPQFGLNWIVLSSAIAIALSFTWSYQMARLRGNSLLCTFVGLVFAMETCTVHWSARPHIFTYLLFLSTYYECFIANRSLLKRASILSVLMLLWGNLHGSFPLGMLMIAARGFGDFLQKSASKPTPNPDSSSVGSASSSAGSDSSSAGSASSSAGSDSSSVGSDSSSAGSASSAGSDSSPTGSNSGSVGNGNRLALWNLRDSAIILICAVLASCLNIRGANFLTYIITYLTSTKIQAHSDEWRSIDFTFALPVWSYLILVCMMFLFWTYSKVKPRLGEFLYMLFLLCVSLYAMRLIPYFALAALPAMAEQAAELRLRENFLKVPLLGSLLKSDNRASESELGMLKQKYLFTGLGLIVGLIFLLIPSFKIADFDPARLPVKAVDYMKEHKIQGLGYVKDNWGSYLYWRTKQPIFIDDKTDFYSQNLLDDYTNIFVTNPGWQKALTKYPFKFILIPRGLPLEFLLEGNEDWKKVYQDDTAALFTKVGQ